MKKTVKIFYSKTLTPYGDLYVAVTGKGVCFISLRDAAWQDFVMEVQHKFDAEFVEDESRTTNAVTELTKYFSGELHDFSLSLDLFSVTPFQRKVLERTKAIPFGEVRSYGELAAEAGNPRASRAVGTTMANNPIPIVIPCHRVIKSDGTIGGFGGGIGMKRSLLDKEGVHL